MPHGAPPDGEARCGRITQVSEGKQIPTPRYADDAGEADPEVLAALVAAAQSPGDVDLQARAIGLVSESRVLVPVIAVLDDLEEEPPAATEGQPLPREKNSHMATAVVAGPDGSRALLAFTSMAAMRAWDAQARPVPVSCREAAESAVAEQADALLIDVAEPHRFVLTGTALAAIAQGWRLLRVDGELSWVATAP